MGSPCLILRYRAVVYRDFASFRQQYFIRDTNYFNNVITSNDI